MARKIVYWITTAFACLALFGSLSYLTGSAEVVAGFAKAGYPQHLRIVLGIAKPIAAIVLLLPGFALLKEWAYAGVTFALVMATISSYLSGEGVKAILPPVILVLLAVSYFTRPPSRRLVGNRFGLMTGRESNAPARIVG
ncbi:MAG: DoxX family protein [Gemmatimonadaceae bacterium]